MKDFEVLKVKYCGVQMRHYYCLSNISNDISGYSNHFHEWKLAIKWQNYPSQHKDVANKSRRQIWKSRWHFLKTLPKRLSGILHRTSLTRLQEFFLVKPKDRLETIYGFSIYLCFKLHIYYHCITRQTFAWILINWIRENMKITQKL